MDAVSSAPESPLHAVVPEDTREKIADAHAYELWGGHVGRGEPIPLSDANGVYAYAYPYIQDADEFPPAEAVLDQIGAMRSEMGVPAGGEHVPAPFSAELRRFGSGFGTICVAATYDDAPVLWMSHFLATYFFLFEQARETARQQLDAEEASFSRYYYYSPEEQYLEFASGESSVVIDAVEPGKEVLEDAVRSRSSGLPAEEVAELVRESWARLTTSEPPDGYPEGMNPAIAPGTGVAPLGISAEELDETHTVKRIVYWELIPKVDHTTKNWCVPSSWAMLLGLYDNYVPGKGTLTGYGRLIDYWYEMTSGGYNLPNLVDDLLSTQGAAKINNYSFAETKTNGSKTAQWNALKGAVDQGRPFFFNTPGHTTLGFGYRVSNSEDKFAIVYDPPNPSVPTYEAEYSLQSCDGIGTVTLKGGDPGQNLVIIEPDGGESYFTSVPNEIVWYVWGKNITKTRLSVSQDGGNTWQVVAKDVPTKGAWNGYAWIPGTTSTGVRVKVEGFNAANSLIAADGSYENLAVKAPTTGTAWKKIWGPTCQVVASSVIGKSGLLLYAVPASGDGVYRYDGTPMAWTKVGGPGDLFALDDFGRLYGLSPGGGAVFRYDGTPMQWTQIGGPAGAIYAGGGLLFATDPASGDIYQYSGKPMAWTKVGGPGKVFAVDRKGRLYGVSPDGSAIFRYDGKPMAWTKIAGPSSGVFAGGCGLYATSGANHDVYAYSLVPMQWTKVGGPGKMFAVDDAGRLYGLSPNGAAVNCYDGAWNAQLKWKNVGGAAGMIFAGGEGRLFATSPQTKDLMSFE